MLVGPVQGRPILHASLHALLHPVPEALLHIPSAAAPFTFDLEGRLKGSTRVTLRINKGAGTVDPEDATQARTCIAFTPLHWLRQ